VVDRAARIESSKFLHPKSLTSIPCETFVYGAGVLDGSRIGRGVLGSVGTSVAVGGSCVGGSCVSVGGSGVSVGGSGVSVGGTGVSVDVLGILVRVGGI